LPDHGARAAIRPRDNVLVTRPEPGASETADRLRILDLVPVVAPLLTIRWRQTRLPPSGEIQAILATSGNAVAALPLSHHGVKLLTVGDATAERARTAGFASVHSADGDAHDLAALAAGLLDPANGPVLLACGSGHGKALADALRTHGFRVSRRIVYATEKAAMLPEAAAAALRNDRLRAALFFSAETAHHFVRLTKAAGLADRARGVQALAIGAAGGVALQDLPWRDVLVAARPTQDELLALLK
jgi:uroporphyrinogen-III synthase